MSRLSHRFAAAYVWCTVVILQVSCGTDPELERLPDGLYTVEYDQQPLLTRRTSGCDRLLSRVLLIITARGTFEMSINVIDDCSRAGEGFSYFETHLNGGYYVSGNELTLSPNVDAPTFAGVLEGEYIRLLLPPALDLAASELEVRVGPRTDL